MGVVLELRPQNSPESVDSFLTSIGWTDQADIPYSITSSSTGSYLVLSL
jgi:sulfite reductase alpha subunit-like flavoprotein